MRTRQSAPAFARLTPVAGALAFESSYDPGLVAEFKRRIPIEARRWDGGHKRWLVDPKYGQLCADMARSFLSVSLEVPQQAGLSTVETRLLKLEYLGGCKSRGAGEASAFGWVEGGWNAIFPEPILRDWFQALPELPGEKPTLYAVLTLKPTATADEIKKAFRRLALQWHPDTSREPGAEAQFKVLKAAYDVLADQLKRRKYDAGLAFEASSKADTLTRYFGAPTVHTARDEVTYRSPLRCGWVLVEGQEALGRFTATAIHQWEDIIRSDGKVMVSSWPAGADRFVVEWI